MCRRILYPSFARRLQIHPMIATRRSPSSRPRSRRTGTGWNVSKWTGLIYDSFGLVSEINGAGNLSKTTFTRNVDARVETERRYTTPSAWDTWSLTYDWLGE